MIIYFNDIGIDLPVNDNSYRYRAIKGEHALTLYYSLPEHVEIPVGAYCEFEGETYTLESPENFKKHNTRNFEYTLIMESAQAKLGKYKFKDMTTRRLKFSLTAKPEEHLQMLVDNLNLRDGDWIVGNCVDSVEKVISYNHAFCNDALAQIAEAFETEWEVVGKTINLCKVEYNKDNPLSLSYGRGNGFKSGLGRSSANSAKPVEILFVQGGERNIDASKYGSLELLLPKEQAIGYDGEYFSNQDGFDETKARWYETDADGFSLRRSDKSLFSHAEDSLDCSNIYPSRIGTISTVEVIDAEKHFYDFIDNGIPANLDFEACLIEGETMTVIFQSGMLTGKEFEVKYKHAERRFEIVSQELDGRTMPDDVFRPAVGDTYAVFGMMMPEAYICDNDTQSGASWDMFREAVKYMYENEEQKFTFTGELDGIWSKKDWLNIGGKIKLGGYVLFTDNQFQPAGVLVRIIGIKDFINNPYSPQIELSNEVVSSSITSDLRKIETNEVIVDDLHKDAIQFTKRRFRDSQEIMSTLEDALLDRFTNSISPVAVQTMAMLVGDESLQFRFVNNTSNPVEVPHAVTYNVETKILTSPAGILQHLTIGINSLSSSHAVSEYRFWTLQEFNTPALTDRKKKYYLYAKVNKVDDTGVFYISETAISMEGVSGYYHLLMGILNSEYNDDRSYAPMYGFTEILPGRMTTDRVISADGKSFLDFVNNAFRVGNQNTAIDWNVTVANALSILNAAIKIGVADNTSGIQLNPDGSGSLGNGAVQWNNDPLNFIFQLADWLIKNGKITSQNTTSAGTPRAQLDGVNGAISFASDISTYTPTGGTKTLEQTIKLDSATGRVEARNKDGDVSYMDSRGIIANRAGMQALPISSGIELKAAMVALGNGNLAKDAYNNLGCVCGVYGDSSNSNSNPAPSYGGYFNKLRANGLILGARVLGGSSSQSITLTPSDSIVISTSTVQQIVYLPRGAYVGAIIFVRQWQGGSVRVYPPTGGKLYDDSSENAYFDITNGQIALFTFIGDYGTSPNFYPTWLMNKMGF
jgi:hypothetical protein